MSYNIKFGKLSDEAAPKLAGVDHDAPPASTDTADTLIGLRSGLRYVHELITSVAPTDVPVLLLGETGSGKELVARMIHQLSDRRAGPLVRVNCGAIPPGLIDSELFGHERGAFTGAVATRRGWFEQADGGTLFLDEIGELPLDAQVRLLRVIQEGELQRVGGDRSVRVDVRVIAATHRDLRARVAQGAFREDLWYRLAIFPVQIPPLRRRLEDIPALAAHFAAAAGARIFSRPLTPTAADLELLLTYDWPGNVRELAAVIERAAILGRGRGLALAAALGRPDRAPLPAPARATPEPSHQFPTLEQIVRAHIERALTAVHGRIEGPSGAAALLGVNPHTLRARMRKLGVHWERFREPTGPHAASRP
ncbi:MAG: sigma-54-dependent Fis family transcriptional regulator [Nannocystis sp.]|nr:sigma-54-dependent Fis family transcriptional regulator [Nannocystis sp.]